MTYIGLTLERFCGVWVFNLKNRQHSIMWRWGVSSKKQDGGWIKICEIFCGKSLKKELLIDTTFDPCYFWWDSPFMVFKKFGVEGIEFVSCIHGSLAPHGPRWLWENLTLRLPPIINMAQQEVNYCLNHDEARYQSTTEHLYIYKKTPQNIRILYV